MTGSSDRPSPAPHGPGSRLGPYELIARLGAGGMGEVFRARDSRIDREVAIKLLAPNALGDLARLRRFEQEARTAGALNHPHVLAVYDVGLDGPVPYLVSELLEGETLRSRLRQGPLPPRKAVELTGQICAGLAAAHEQRVVHRDIKPENLFLTRAGHLKILDFGLAKLRAPPTETEVTTAITAASGGLRTGSGVILGTVGYMSPEQIRGEALDGRSDIFSLGAVLYEMLSGDRAFGGPTHTDTLHAILHADPPPVGERVPPGLERVARRCLEKRPDERFQSARDVGFALDAVSVHSSPLAPSAVPISQPRGPLRLAAAALVLTGLIGAAFLAGRAAPPQPVFKQLTFRRGTIHAARFAPGGHTVVYAAAFEGAPTQVFTTRLEGPAFSPLALPSANLLAVSASGELALALDYSYRHNQGRGRLARAPLAGGAPRDVLESVEAADWAPDGASLAVVRSAAGKSRLEFPVGTVLFETHGWISHPRVAPDGDRVAFLVHPSPDQQGSVAVVDRGGTARTLVKDLVSVYGLAWHPSGREVWFTASRQATHNSLRAVDLDGQERSVYEAPARLILHDVFRDGQVLIAVESLRGEVAGRVPGETRERPLHWLDFSIATDISPDGSHLLLTEGGEGAGKDFQIYLRTMDDRPPVHLGAGFVGVLSPDGRWVLAKQPSGPERLLLLPTGAGKQATIERHGLETYQSACWFPDGERIVFAGTEPGRGRRLYVQAVAGGPPRAFTAEGVRLSPGLANPVAPDGLRITAFGPEGTLSLYPLDGGEPRPLPAMHSEDELVRWIDYGRSTYVWRPLERPSPIYSLDLGSGQRSLLKSLFPSDPAGVGGLLTLVMTPDGRGYAYTYTRELAELYVVQGLR